jgi:hypothetical protein
MLKNEYGEVNKIDENIILQEFYVLPLGAKVHWFFVQGFKAIHRDLYIPGNLSLLNGIEISIRQTLHLCDGKSNDTDLNSWEIMKDSMLAKALKDGLPISKLSFPDEDIVEVITKRNATSQIVKVRNDLCHGNVHQFVQNISGSDEKLFTPECTRELAEALMKISRVWVKELAQFCKNKGIKA